jgi:hypothetical protein
MYDAIKISQNKEALCLVFAGANIDKAVTFHTERRKTEIEVGIHGGGGTLLATVIRGWFCMLSCSVLFTLMLFC